MKAILPFLILLVLISCGKKAEKPSTPASIVEAPRVNGDSAYAYVKRQVDFGPRVPNTKAHQQTAAWLEQEFKKNGAQVIIQSFRTRSIDGNDIELKNIIAVFNPEKQKRIMLAAHWDTRPYADKDSLKRYAPFDGANDGASGVGILLEVARQLKSNPLRAGVDIVLFDGEDWGPKDGVDQSAPPLPPGVETWWCLGSQYWSKNKHKPNYRAYYGILLDMVGGNGTRFFREGTSMEYAPRIVDKVWNAGATLGYSDYFIPQNVGAITDDHYFVNTHGSIPMIDIVPFAPNGQFGSFHHTTADNMDIISKATLEAVGNTVLYVIYQEE